MFHWPVRSLLLTLVTLLLPAAVWAQPEVWTIDAGHSAATFSVRHMVVSNVKGEFAGPVGTATFDLKDLSTVRLEATIDARTGGVDPAAVSVFEQWIGEREGLAKQTRLMAVSARHSGW